MIEALLQAIVSFFEEIIFQGIIVGVLRLIQTIGILTLKAITLSDKSISKLKNKYKDSSKPYLLGFATTFGIIYLLSQSIN